MILLPAVILAALAGGRVAGLIAVIACLFGGWAIAGPGAMGVGIATALGRVATVNFVIVGLFSTLVAASLRKTVARLDGTVSTLEAIQTLADETETRFRDISDVAPVMLWTADANGRIYVNAEFRRFWGDRPLSMDDPAPWLDAVHPDDRDAVFAASMSAFNDRTPLDLEARYRRADGQWRRLQTRAGLRFDSRKRFIGMVGANIDVTEARAGESDLRESEERFRLMADTAPSPVWLTNADAEVEFVNAALVAFYGRPGETFMGHAWKVSVHPDDLGAVGAIQTEARLTHSPYAFEARFQRHDGVWRWMRVSVNPRFGGDGAFQGYVGMSFDVTETREALDALAVQERRQRFLLEMADGVRELEDPQAIMDHVQSVLGRLVGASRVGYGEISQDRQTIEVRPDWVEGVPSVAGRLPLESFGGKVEAEMFEGQIVSVEDVETDPRTSMAVAAYRGIQVAAFVVVPLFRGGEMRAFLQVHSVRPRVWTPDEIALIADVADRTWSDVERARAEAEMRESEARFRDIADTAPVLIWVTKADRSRAFVNQAYVDYMGGDYESVRTADWRAFIHPDDQAGLMAESLAGEATGQPFALEARYLHHSGEHRWLKSFSRPRLGPGGEVIGFVGVAFDVTDARRVETDLKRINELLEGRVGDALAEKAKAEADLMHAQRMEAVGRLTGGVAHDFNNLLTVVIGALDLILKSPEDAGRRQKLGEAALSAARRGERLTHQLLAFSRRQALRPEAVDINALIRESDPLFRRAVGEAVSYKLKLKRGGVRVIVDPAQFEAALLNLIVNARDAVAERGDVEGATVTVQTLACTVGAGEVVELTPADYVCVTVSDTGAGMDEATMRRVFEPFFTTKAVGKGTGLGLSQVYGFARQSGGGVKITSSVGEGTEIRVYLPPAPVEQAEPNAGPRRTPGAMKAGQTLLLVEDDTGVAAIAMDLLRGMGLEVETAETAPEALARLEHRSFDVMLSDIVMPGGMTGVELARTCAERWPAMSIMLTSGYAGDDVDLALADAPWPFLRKPYSGEQLREALGDLLITTAAPGTP
ncbi:MAG: PAS domain-containing protein [Alphaproteobacteria bacterium]|nr:PAS domain-containing protein [Alphaproteobacteria bacterium]MBU2380612.1 PAS domain-containing protein [Alphaproteobacteria bacterium]